MDLHTNHPYWLMKNGSVMDYPALETDIETDIAILGSGISGALAAYYLYRDDLKVTILDKRRAGTGSTAASTSLLQYELDVPLYELAGKVGKKNAIHAYKMCREAISDLRQICKKLRTDTGFKLRPSLQYASDLKHRHGLYREFGMRLKSGFRVNWLDSAEVEKLFGFSTPGAILSEEAAEVDPYLLTHALLAYVRQKQYGVYDNTEVTGITYDNNRIFLKTAADHTVKARKLIVAAGYETLSYLPNPMAELYSTYALVSEPIPHEGDFWYQNSLIWETGKPYMYMRTTDDGRLLIEGKDDPFTSAAARDAKLKNKTAQLVQSFSSRFPHLRIRPEYAWAGTFASTDDGLPYIGSIPGMPDTYFSLGVGGNGIVFGVIAAQLIRDMIRGRTNRESEIFSFNR